MNGMQRIELIVLDIVERLKVPQDIRIKRNGETLYMGSATRTPKELLNEPVLHIYSTEYFNYIGIEIAQNKRALPSLVRLFISVTPVL